tara:strand:- start:282 stop:446 length:165 start_codon:yes stop_codon:yes gene_type:complete
MLGLGTIGLKLLGATALVIAGVWPSWARSGAGYMVRIFIREQAPSCKQQAQKKY